MRGGELDEASVTIGFGTPGCGKTPLALALLTVGANFGITAAGMSVGQAFSRSELALMEPGVPR